MTDAIDALRFRADQFTLEQREVDDDGQKHRITLRQYLHIPYVARPLDPEYQSLDVLVPVAIDDAPVDASNAPILLNIRVGGYLSSSNLREHAHRPAHPKPANALRRADPGPGIDQVRNQRVNLALAAGYVVVTPGARGRDNRFKDGRFFGKAPAAIVDLKAAVRYIRHNAGRLPGNPEWIITAGGSAGGGLSALLGTSGNCSLYEPYLEEIGAAKTQDHVFASICLSPITDLEHADLSYEWFFGPQPCERGPYDIEISAKLAEMHEAYQDSLGLTGHAGFGTVSQARLDEYLYTHYLQPSASVFLQALDAETRSTYLAEHPWLRWDGACAHFCLADLALDIGRGKGAPAFDGFPLDTPENSLFGDAGTASRSYTDFSLQYLSGNSAAHIDEALATRVRMMNAMQFARDASAQHAHYWLLRNGTHDRGVDPAVMVNLGTCLENHGHDVETTFYWTGGHCADGDPAGSIAWIGRITGYRNALS